MIKSVFALINLEDQAVNPLAKFNSVATIANLIIPNLLLGAGIIFFIMIIIAGYQFMASSGKEENLQKAQKLFTTSIIGFIIVLGSFLLIKLLASLFQIKNSQLPL